MCEAEHLDRHVTTRDSFRRDGTWTEKWQRNADGTEWSAVRRFDAEGRVLFEQRNDPRGLTLACQYDAQGRLVRVDETTSDGAERVRESYLHHEDGTSAVTRYISPPLRDTNVAASSEIMLHMSADAVCIMTVRDREDRPAKRVLYDADNRVMGAVFAPICVTCTGTTDTATGPRGPTRSAGWTPGWLHTTE
jgi:YD repeat-containing protein